MAFVHQSTQQYDLIAMDVFLDDVIPDDFEQIEYLSALKSLLKPNGVLLYNRLALDKKDLETTQAFFQDKFLKVFPDGHYLDVEGNWILMNNSNPLTK